MANTYDTSAFPLGSKDPRVLYNNAENEDLFMNDLVNEYFVDRPPFLRNRLTLFGMNQTFYRTLANMGFESTYLTYGAGVVIQRPTQLVVRSGVYYRVTNPTNVPLTLTGNWATDSLLLTDVGDASLRQFLATTAGSGAIGDTSYSTVAVGLSALKAAVLPQNLVRPVVVDASSDRTFALTDIRNFDYTANASGVVRTVPTDAAVAFPVGSEISALNHGVGAYRAAVVSGVTLIIPNGKVNKITPNGQGMFKKVGVNLWALTGDLEPGQQTGQYAQFGDSITFGVGSTPSGSTYVIGYAQLQVAGFARTMTNQAISASMVADQAVKIFAFTTSANFTGQIMLGTNDKRVYLDNAARKDCFYQGYLSCLAWMCVPDTLKVFPNNAAVTLVGSWGSSSYGKINTKFSTTVGNTATFPFYGKTVYFQYLKVDGITGTAEIYIDGSATPHGTIDLAGPGTGTILAPAATGGVIPGTYRVSGLVEGPHTIQVKITALGGTSPALTLLGVSVPSKEAIKPRVNVLTIIRETDASTDARTTAYNALITTAVGLLKTDGLDIVISDANSAVNPATDMADNLHPNDAGHFKIYRRSALDF